MKVVAISLLLSIALLAQAPATIPAVAIYQQALANGIIYVSPSVAQAVVNEKSFFSWPNVVKVIASDAPMGLVIGQLSNIFRLPAWIPSAAAGEKVLYDEYGNPIVTAAAQSALQNIPTILTLNMTMTVGSENTIFASSVRTTTLDQAKKGFGGVPIGPIMIGGLPVTFSPQVGNGMRSKKFIPIDVLVGAAANPAAALRGGNSVTINPDAPLNDVTFAAADEAERNGNHALAVLLREKLWQQEPSQGVSGASFEMPMARYSEATLPVVRVIQTPMPGDVPLKPAPQVKPDGHNADVDAIRVTMQSLNSQMEALRAMQEKLQKQIDELSKTGDK